MDKLKMDYIFTFKFNLSLKVKVKNPTKNRDLNQGILQLWSKFGDPSLNKCLTHCGLVMLYGDIDLGQHWFR